jgi:hypothetical protein
MFKFLAGLEFWQLIIFSIITLGTIIFIIKKGKFKIFNSKGGIIVNGDDKDMPLQARHGACPYVYDILGVINKTAEISSRIFSVKESVLKEQIKYSEQKLLVFSDILKQSIIEGLIHTGEEDPTKTQGYEDYVLLLELLEYKLGTFFRNSFIDNNFSRFKKDNGIIDASKFNKYVEEKVLALESITNELFNRCYKTIATINREALRKLNNTVASELNKIFAEIFSNALDVFLNGMDKIVALDMELKQHIKKVIGVDLDEKVEKDV